MDFLQRLNHLLLRIGFFAVFAGGLLALQISSTFAKPLANLVDGVKALEQGDYDYQLQARGGGEIAKLTSTFDQMRRTLQRNEAERQQLEEQLRQSQKMEALGRLAGGVAHDFNNLLTIIKGHSDLLLDRLDVSDVSYKSGEQIHKATDRASALTRQLLVFSRRQVLQPKVLNLNLLVTEMDKLLRRLIREDVEFVFLPGPHLRSVKADPGQIGATGKIANGCIIFRHEDSEPFCSGRKGRQLLCNGIVLHRHVRKINFKTASRPRSGFDPDETAALFDDSIDSRKA
jgi:signal transduction histidine kinase